MRAQHKNTVAGQWIEKAENDLKNAVIVIRESDPPTDTICFHCHQVMEKYLKAYLVENNIGFKKVHDLKYLLNECKKTDVKFEELNSAAEVLNLYYIESRYPLDLPIYYPVEEAKQAVDLAYVVKKFVQNKLRR